MKTGETELSENLNFYQKSNLQRTPFYFQPVLPHLEWEVDRSCESCTPLRTREKDPFRAHFQICFYSKETTNIFSAKKKRKHNAFLNSGSFQ